MEKVIRDGKVAILVSKDFGAGWYSWNINNPEILFHPKIVKWVEDGKKEDIDDILSSVGLENIYSLGAMDLEIVWLPLGTLFRVDEYDGSESIVTKEENNWILA